MLHRLVCKSIVQRYYYLPCISRYFHWYVNIFLVLVLACQWRLTDIGGYFLNVCLISVCVCVNLSCAIHRLLMGVIFRLLSFSSLSCDTNTCHHIQYRNYPTNRSILRPSTTMSNVYITCTMWCTGWAWTSKSHTIMPNRSAHHNIVWWLLSVKVHSLAGPEDKWWVSTSKKLYHGIQSS